MEARLIAIVGPLKGTTIPLTDAETIIGRDPANTVAVNDPLVSRRHCSIRHCGTQIQLSDLESLNGTFVNGVPAREKPLEHGDRIRVGGSQFVFMIRDEGVETPIPLSDSFSGELITTVTVKLDRLDPGCLHHDSGTETLARKGRLARD